MSFYPYHLWILQPMIPRQPPHWNFYSKVLLGFYFSNEMRDSPLVSYPSAFWHCWPFLPFLALFFLILLLLLLWLITHSQSFSSSICLCLLLGSVGLPLLLIPRFVWMISSSVHSVTISLLVTLNLICSLGLLSYRPIYASHPSLSGYPIATSDSLCVDAELEFLSHIIHWFQP